MLESLEDYFSVEDNDRFMEMVKDEEMVPEKFMLSQSYPNQFNPVTTIEFSLPKASSVKIEVFNSNWSGNTGAGR